MAASSTPLRRSEPAHDHRPALRYQRGRCAHACFWLNVILLDSNNRRSVPVGTPDLFVGVTGVPTFPVPGLGRRPRTGNKETITIINPGGRSMNGAFAGDHIVCLCNSSTTEVTRFFCLVDTNAAKSTRNGRVTCIVEYDEYRCSRILPPPPSPSPSESRPIKKITLYHSRPNRISVIDVYCCSIRFVYAIYVVKFLCYFFNVLIIQLYTPKVIDHTTLQYWFLICTFLVYF